MQFTPDPADYLGVPAPHLLSDIGVRRREVAIKSCRKLTDRIDPGLNLTEEIRAVMKQKLGDVVLLWWGSSVEAFAICMNGPGTEGGKKFCYVKFACARSNRSFKALLQAVEVFASSRGLTIEAGLSLDSEASFRRMKIRGYRIAGVGVAMHRPHVPEPLRPGIFILSDWR